MVDATYFYRLQVVLGALVLALNLVAGVRLLRAWRLRQGAVLTWRAARPPYYGLSLFIGVVFGVLVMLEVFVIRRSAGYWFFDLMMLFYYGYLTPLAARVPRGLYERGIWADGGFVPFEQVARLAWREEPAIVLTVVSRVRQAVYHLTVPQQFYAEARRVLRDRLAGHDIHFVPPALDLGAHDARDDV
jgi:hypothetical protein